MASAKPHNPPQLPPLFTATPISILESIKELIETSKQAHKDLVNTISPSSATFANTLLPLAHAENALSSEATLLIFLRDVSPDKEVRDAAAQARTILRDYQLEASMNEDVFKMVDSVFATADKQSLDPESRNLLSKKYKEFVKNGLRIPSGERRDRFKEIRSRIDALTSKYSKNLAEDNTAIYFAPDELEGFPEDTLSELEKGQTGTENEGKLKIEIPMDLSSVLRAVKNPATGQKARLAYDNRCPANVAIFKEVVQLRHEAALLLGYPNHAALSVEDKMTATRIGKDVETLLRLKKADVKARGEDFDGHYFTWDNLYYDNMLLQQDFAVDQAKISEYFPLQSTVNEMLGVFEQLFGMVFHEILDEERASLSSTGKGDDLVWHPDVQTFSVWNKDEEGGGFLGYLYLDLYSREGKYSNPSNFSVVPGYCEEDETKHYPSTALVCNFQRPSASKPTLLRHPDVVVLFHQLGHGIHDLVSRTKFARFHGPMGTVVDFGEAPSQVLENWCWTPEQIISLSHHYSYLSDDYLNTWKSKIGKNEDIMQPPKALPRAMVESLLKAKHANKALDTLHQLFIGTFDMAVHQLNDRSEDQSFTTLWNRLRRDIVPTDDLSALGAGDEWGHGYTNIGHFMNEYDAGFYSYLFSKVYAQDIFSTVFKSDPMSVEAGRRYRHGVLEKGGSQPEMTTLQEFLGREAKMEALYEDLGLELR
ncbi:metallopeptidase [Colletotrichum chrysophilum]|uniref:Metallopeptidase n=1 Tax=Colletotrichum chrysophilum TaxID=1836956 RepID=A0AAD9AAM5_9PEZI|nr:metallopeptidase [Colletotrichum chrysophilum]